MKNVCLGKIQRIPATTPSILPEAPTLGNTDINVPNTIAVADRKSLGYENGG